MSVVDDFLASGILERYVMGQTSPEENARVMEMVAIYNEISNELDSMEEALGQYAQLHAIEPDPTIKPFLMATIDYMERLGNGEQPAFPPKLNADSKAEDFAEWLNREDFVLTAPLKEIHAKIISHTAEMTSAVVWLEHGAPPEIHNNELEVFLIVEGTCNIVVDGQDNNLKPGDVFSIPLHLSHHVIVTSDHPCKIILQRIAA